MFHDSLWVTFPSLGLIYQIPQRVEIPELSVCGLNADTYPGSSLKPCLSAVNPLSSCFILLYFAFSLLSPLDPLRGYLRDSLDPTAPRHTSSSTGSVSACLRTWLNTLIPAVAPTTSCRQSRQALLAPQSHRASGLAIAPSSLLGNLQNKGRWVR